MHNNGQGHRNATVYKQIYDASCIERFEFMEKYWILIEFMQLMMTKYQSTEVLLVLESSRKKAEKLYPIAQQ